MAKKPRKSTPPIERFWKHVQKTDSCWLFLGYRYKNGYGKFDSGSSYETRHSVLAHRFAYEALVGPLPSGHAMQLDHLCGNKACVNPAHLELVPARVNTMRCDYAPATINANKTHCINGHQFTPENTYIVKDGNGYARSCRACSIAKASAYQKRKRRALAA